MIEPILIPEPIIQEQQGIKVVESIVKVQILDINKEVDNNKENNILEG